MEAAYVFVGEQSFTGAGRALTGARGHHRPPDPVARSTGLMGGLKVGPYSPHVAKASLKARSPGEPFSMAMMARR
jgi:hypothetical protein